MTKSPFLNSTVIPNRYPSWVKFIEICGSKSVPIRLLVIALDQRRQSALSGKWTEHLLKKTKAEQFSVCSIHLTFLEKIDFVWPVPTNGPVSAVVDRLGCSNKCFPPLLQGACEPQNAPRHRRIKPA